MMTTEGKQLKELVAQIVHKRRDAVRINPTWIANEAMLVLDPGRASITLVYLGCHLHLRQIARAVLRELFEPEDEAEGARDDLFPELQWRYPQPHRKDEEPSYILREQMSRADVRFNVDRLRHEAEAKMAHADALEAWDLGRKLKA